MIHRGSVVPLGEHELSVARTMLDAIQLAIDAGTVGGDGIVREGRSLRLDDESPGHAGIVLEMPPHDTGPFADREREMRLRIHDPALMDRIATLGVQEAATTILAAARTCVDHAAAPPTRGSGIDDFTRGSRYARLLACERSVAAGGEAVSTTVLHPWGDVPGFQGGPLANDPLDVPLPPIMHCLVSWDPVDVDLAIGGVRHDASLRAADDPVATLRMIAELTRLRGK